MPFKEYGFVVLRSTATKKKFRRRDPTIYRTVYERKDFNSVPNDIPLTKKAIDHWREVKDGMGYANFKTLTKSDLKSIISAAKRGGEVVFTRNRMGFCTVYKLRGMRK